MAEEHAEMQMIQRALVGTTERVDECNLDKIGRMRNADEGRIGIELPPLNAALVEVHRELATVEALTKHINIEAHAKQKILEMRGEAKKQQQWFEDKVASRAELAKQAEKILKDQIAGIEERHAKEAQLWADIKLQYEVRAQGHTAKINTL